MVTPPSTPATPAFTIDELKSEFISTVSHELRTPLTSIGGYVQLIKEGDAGPVTDTQLEFLSIIETNVTRLTELINDILDLERLENVRLEVQKEPQDLAEILRECREGLLLMAHHKGLEFRLELPPHLPLILGERGRLVQIFNNLLSNAIKYTRQGSIEVSVLVQEAESVSVRIKDTGIGISSEDQKKIFQKFFRSNSTLASDEKGTGLGLTITRGLVEAHGGSVDFQSETGKGSTFEVRFPITAPTVSIGELAKEGAIELIEAIHQVENRAKGFPETIYVVDENGDSRDHFRRMIERAEHCFSVRSFSSSEKVPFLSEGEPSPALVIFNHPEVQKLSDLRRKLRTTTPIVVIGDPTKSTTAFAEGASAILPAMVNERNLWKVVQELTQARGLRVLVADTNLDFRILIKRVLEQRGFEVDDVDRGSHVMARLEQGRYNLLLMDHDFSDVPADELLRAIRKRGQFSRLPVFLLSDGQAIGGLSEVETMMIEKSRGIDGIVDLIAEKLQ